MTVSIQKKSRIASQYFTSTWLNRKSNLVIKASAVALFNNIISKTNKKIRLKKRRLSRMYCFILFAPKTEKKAHNICAYHSLNKNSIFFSLYHIHSKETSFVPRTNIDVL